MDTKNFELLELKEFARRLKVGKTTIYNWKQQEILQPGIHFIKRGKVLRFFWSQKLVMDIHDKTSKTKEVEKTTKKILPKKQIGVNLDY